MTRHAIARFVYEVTATAELPLHIYGCAIMIYHAFMEYMPHDKKDSLMLGVTCLTVAVKFKENFLNSYTALFKHRSSLVVDAAARVLLSYSKASNECSVEALSVVKREVQESVNGIELSVLKIIGNYGGSIKTAFETNTENSEYLVEVYSNPICLNFPSNNLIDNEEVKRIVSNYI